MTRNEFYYRSADKKTNIHAVEWLPKGEPKAILNIAHGITEHIMSYEEMAEFFAKRGFAVVGNDALGHGLSIADGARPMYPGAEGSWKWIEEDMYTCQCMLRKRYPEIPCFVLGLSLGSFIVRSFLIHHPGAVDGAILAGTGQTSAVELHIVKWVTKREAYKAGEDAATPLVKKLAFETYNKRFQPNRTEYDWLCADREGLDAYIGDKLRGRELSAGMFREMLNAMLFAGNMKNQQQMNKKEHIFLISGAEDPVGDNGKGVKKTFDSFRKAGVDDVTMKLYPGLRHDIFREKERRDIFGDIYNWIEKKI